MNTKLSPVPCHESARTQLTGFLVWQLLRGPSGHLSQAGGGCVPSSPRLPGRAKDLGALPLSAAALQSTSGTPDLCAETMLVNKMGITLAFSFF